MKINSVNASPDSSAAINGPWQIKSVVSEPPQKFFRQTLYLRFNTGGAADRIVIDEQSTVFDAVFQPRDYDMRIAGPLAAPQFSSGPNESLIVKLETPLQLNRVVLSPDIDSAIDYDMKFHRLDGNALSEKPTVIANVDGNTANLSTDATAGFKDARFAIHLIKKDGGIVQLKANQISELHILSYPTGARIAIADPNDFSTAVFFWRAVGELKNATSVKQVDGGAGLNMAKELQRQLDAKLAKNLEALSKGTLEALPDHVVIALVIESDAPCAFDITSLSVVYRLALESFPSRDEKQVLRFDGKQLSAQEVSFNLPGDAVIESATFKAVESFSGDRPDTIAENDLLKSVGSHDFGAHVSSDRWAAQSITPRRPLSASGLILAVMALGKETELQVELHDDWQGQPSGHKLAAGTLALKQIGSPVWTMLLFPEPVTIASQPHWVLVKATSGSAVWLLKESASPVRMLEESSQTKTFNELFTLKGKGALFQFFSQGSRLQNLPPASVSLEKIRLSEAAGENGAKTFDLRPALTEFLKNKDASKTLTIPLLFTSAVAGIVTVYPPRIEYSLPDKKIQPDLTL